MTQTQLATTYTNNSARTLRSLVKEAGQLYPNSKYLRKQWVNKTVNLISNGKHVLYGGNVSWSYVNKGIAA